MAISDERVYLNEKGEATRNASEGVKLLAGEGGQISDADAKKYGVKLREVEAKDDTPHITITPGVNHPGGRIEATPAEGAAQTVAFNRTADGDAATASELAGDESPAKGKTFGDDKPE
jgi:hypothetical protein